MANILTYQATLAAKSLQTSQDIETIKKDLAEREAKRQRIRSAFNRPAQYRKLINEQISLAAQKLNLQLERNKFRNQVENRKAIEGDNYLDSDYNRDLQKINDEYERKIGLVDSKITINGQELRELDDNFFGLRNPDREKKSQEDKQKIREARKREIRRNRVKIPKIKFQFIERFKSEPNKFRAVINGISVIATALLKRIGVNNAKVELLVDEVLILVEEVKLNPTPGNISAAKLERDLALQFITLNRNYLQSLDRLVSSLGLIQNILSAILAVLSLFPVPPPIKVVRTFDQISRAIEDMAGLFSTANFLISLLLEELNFQESRLKDATGFLDANLDGLTADEIAALIGDGLGYLNGFDYKGFRFFLKEEENPDPEFIIKGNKRKYAVAVDTSDIERLQSEYSFTLDPAVLVEQLKLEIDKQNLVA